MHEHEAVDTSTSLKSLGLLPTTLHEKMKRLGLLRRPEPRAEQFAS